MKEVYHDVTVEPLLQSLSGEHFAFRTACADSEARLDVAASGFFFGGRFQRSLFSTSEFLTLERSQTKAASRLHTAGTRRKNDRNMVRG